VINYSGSLLNYLDDIFVCQLVRYTHLLGRVLATLTPNVGVIEVCQKPLMDLHDARAHCQAVSTSSQNQRVSKVRRTPFFLCVYSDQAQRIPYLFSQDLDTKIVFGRYNAVVRLLHDFGALFDRDGIYFIVDEDAADVLSIAFYHVNQVINVVVASEVNVRIVNLVLLEDMLHHLLVYLCQFGH